VLSTNSFSVMVKDSCKYGGTSVTLAPAGGEHGELTNSLKIHPQ